MGCVLIPVIYRNLVYPDGVVSGITEVAGHFDVKNLNIKGPYSLHTEYSYARRSFDSQLMSTCKPILRQAKSDVPALWYNHEWAREFAEFVFKLVGGNQAPNNIEVHPPFSDYTPSIGEFLNRYEEFEQRILDLYPSAQILLENRCGSLYRGGRFIIMNAGQIIDAVNQIETKGLQLRFTLDVPQLFTGYTRASFTELINHLLSLIPVRDYIDGIHLWGKRKNKAGKITAHVGDFNSYFDNDKYIKSEFLDALYHLLDDNKPRFFVPEVNSGSEDFNTIIGDLTEKQFTFQ